MKLQELMENHEGTKLESPLGGYQEFDERQREFTVPQFTQAIWDSIENWDWEAEDEGLRMLDALVGIDADYVRDVFADDDGMVRLDAAYKDVWDKIDEFARATVANM